MSDASPVAPAPLDQAEKAEFDRLKRTVHRAMEGAGRTCGEALLRIRDRRLYRETHRSFEAFVLDEYGFSRATAYRMIDDAKAPDPVGELVERAKRETAGQRVSARDTSASEPEETGSRETRNEEPGDPAPDAPPMTPTAPRLWAVVERVDHPLFASLPGALVLGYEPGATPELPAAGTRVLVAWER